MLALLIEVTLILLGGLMGLSDPPELISLASEEAGGLDIIARELRPNAPPVF